MEMRIIAFSMWAEPHVDGKAVLQGQEEVEDEQEIRAGALALTKATPAPAQGLRMMHFNYHEMMSLELRFGRYDDIYHETI